MTEKITIIANRGSGSYTEDLVSKLRERAAELGLKAAVQTLSPGESATSAAQLAREQGATTIAVCGGDGTMGAVAQALAGTPVKLLPLPGGTFNHFARDLGIHVPPIVALESAVSGQVRQVDVGEVNGKVFVNNASLGLYPAMVSQRLQQQRLGKNRWRALLWACASVFRRYPVARLRLLSGGEEMARRTPLVFLGNNDYQIEGVNIGTRQRLDAGHLSVYVLRDNGRMALVRYFSQALVGRFQHDGGFDHLCTESVTIESRHKHVRLALDGELMRLATPLEFRVRPRALTVIGPGTTEAD